MNIPDLLHATSLRGFPILIPAYGAIRKFHMDAPSNKKLTPAWRQVHLLNLDKIMSVA